MVAAVHWTNSQVQTGPPRHPRLKRVVESYQGLPQWTHDPFMEECGPEIVGFDYLGGCMTHEQAERCSTAQMNQLWVEQAGASEKG